LYDRHDREVALALYQLAAGLDPDNETYLASVIDPCLTDEPVYPQVALPYAIKAATLNPIELAQDKVVHIETLIQSRAQVSLA